MRAPLVAHRLRRAQKQLEQGRADAALRHAWRAATQAAQQRDNDALGALHDFAREFEATSENRLAHDARQLARFCESAVEENDLWRQGFRRRGWFFRPRAEFKICPDCAETVPAAANVCRYCGYRFS